MVTYAWKSYFIHNVRIEYVQKLIMKCLIYGRSRQSPFPFPIQLAKPGVPITARIGGDIFLPKDRQGDVLAPHLAMQDGPIWLCMTPMARLDAGIGEKQLLQHGVGQTGIQRAGDPRRLAAL